MEKQIATHSWASHFNPTPPIPAILCHIHDVLTRLLSPTWVPEVHFQVVFSLVLSTANLKLRCLPGSSCSGSLQCLSCLAYSWTLSIPCRHFPSRHSATSRSEALPTCQGLPQRRKPRHSVWLLIWSLSLCLLGLTWLPLHPSSSSQDCNSPLLKDHNGIISSWKH